MAEPVARSPIEPPPPREVVGGWLVSGRRSEAPLRITDSTPLAKVLIRAHPTDPATGRLEAAPGASRRIAAGGLAVRSGPSETLLWGPPGTASRLAASIPPSESAAVVDVTHALAAVRVSGPESALLLSEVCSLPLDHRSAPPGWAAVTRMAGVRVGIVRDDHGGERSYLLWCERASGAYLFEVLEDAGPGPDVDGFRPPGI